MPETSLKGDICMYALSSCNCLHVNMTIMREKVSAQFFLLYPKPYENIFCYEV